jgi:hypothetical protein
VVCLEGIHALRSACPTRSRDYPPEPVRLAAFQSLDGLQAPVDLARA